MKDNIKAGLLTLFLGSFGDILSRILWYGCSLSKPWTLLFVLPPLSIVSSIMYFLDKIQKAAGCKKSFDWFLLVIPLFLIGLAYTIMFSVENAIGRNTLMFIGTFILFMMVRMYKSHTACKEHFKYLEEQGKTTNWLEHVKRAAIISGITNAVIMGFNKMAPYGRMIPVVGIAFRIWGMLGFLPGLQHAILLTFVHFIMNLNENTPNTLYDLCHQNE